MRHRIALWTVNRVVTKDHWRRSKLRSPRTSSTWRCTETEFVIAKHGERVKWRHRRDVVLFNGRYVYWREQGVINRTFRLSYMKGGRPDEKVLAKIRKRFGRTRLIGSTIGGLRGILTEFWLPPARGFLTKFTV